MNRFKLASVWIFFLFGFVQAQSSHVFYAGGTGNHAFYDVVQIENGQFLVAGTCDNLDWIPAGVPKTIITETSIVNSQGSGSHYGFIARFDSLFEFMDVVYLAQGTAEDIRFMKFTHIPGEPTGDLFISGNTSDSRANSGGYFIGKLNHNFVDEVPTEFVWVRNVWAENEIKKTHPWDVGSDGKVVYGRGQYQANDWAAVHRLDENGEQEVVENWRMHWGEHNGGGFEWRQTPASAFAGDGALSHSGIVFKRLGRCDLRSWTQADFDAWLPDGNGGTKKGTWPLDAFFTGPCDPAAPTGNMPGYTGYSLASTPTYGATCITVDRRNNHFYIGFTAKSILPGGNPDFEPAVIAMDQSGALKWWSRLYHEVTPDGDTLNSTPDQYVDALAVDYSQEADEAFLVVNARCHGNNVENLWEGNTILANPATSGFQNRFTGTSGNIHISWLGKLKLNDGRLFHSTYVAEYANGGQGTGSPHTDPLLDNWPDPNGGWPELNTTRLTKNNMKVTRDGSVCVLGSGRRTLTTANAYQKMPLPGNGGQSVWNSFVRVYESDFSRPSYSSLIVGAWDTLTQSGGDNTRLYGLFKTRKGVVAVGEHLADQSGNAEGVPIPVAGQPSWGSVTPVGQTGIIAFLTAAELENPDDRYPGGTNGASKLASSISVRIFPNPATSQVDISVKDQGKPYQVTLFGFNGQIMQQRHFTSGTRLD
ncbi:MAG: T9SS type A sorting domain-containing protein, partial [Bacteroidota bacterium]